MRAVVVSVNLANIDYAAHAEEYLMLARGAGARVLDVIQANRNRPDPAFFIGPGKLQEVQDAVEAHQADIILFDQPLSPAQQRNIEQATKVRVFDRVILILDIFAIRAQSHVCKLQFELYELKYLSLCFTGN